MKLVRLKVENFMSIGNIDIELDKPGMNLVLGKNLDDARFDSNGSAKSALFEAMTWGLFGEFLRDLTAETVIRNGTSKVTVEVLVDPEDGSERVWFTRYRTKKVHAVNVLSESGIELFPANSVKDIQPQINTWLGLDFKTFTNSVYFGKGLVKFFMASNDAERKDLLETILQLVSFDDALERAKALSRKCGEDIVEYNTTIAVTKALEEERTITLNTLKEQLDIVECKIHNEGNILKTKATKLQEDRDKIYQSIGRLDHLISKEKELFDEEEGCINIAHIKNKAVIDNVYATKIEEGVLENTKKTKTLTNTYLTLLAERQEFCKNLEEKQAGLLTKKFLIEMDVSKTKGLIEAINKDVEHIQGLSENIPCKECFQKISIINKNSLLRKYYDDLGPYHSLIQKLVKEIETIDIEIFTGYKNPLKEVKRVITEIENTQNYKLELLQKEKFDTTYGFIIQRDNEIGNLNKDYVSQLNRVQDAYHIKTSVWLKEKNIRNVEVIQLDNEIITIGKTIADMEETQHRIKKAINTSTKEIEKISQQHIYTKEKIEATLAINEKTKFWIEGFGPRGIKSFIFEAALPYLTERTNHYSSYITGGTIKIDITPTTVVKSKGNKEEREKLNVSANNQYGADVYSGHSDGERRRIDICLLLALQDLISTRASKQWSTLIFDEIFDCLDKTGIEHVIDLFRTFKDKSIYIISHSEDIKKHFDTAMTIQKKDGVSSIKEII